MDPQTFSGNRFGIAAGRRLHRRAQVRPRQPPPAPARDYFRDLGVRPFINAAGTYTAMTASLMPPEVMEAINYASRHYVMLDELHDKVGERIAALVHAEGAMVTSGAAAALTLGTAAVLTGTDRQKIVDLPNLAGMKSEVIVQKTPSLRLRACRSQLRRDAGGSGNGGRRGPRGQRQDRDDALLQQQQSARADPGRSVRPAREETRHPHAQRRRRRRAAGRESVEVHEDGFRSRGVLRAAKASADRRAPDC